jgi:molybdenum cofactor biosynthesis protein B
MGHLDHKAQAPPAARCYVLTISDTRSEATDTSGTVISELLRADGHQVTGRRLVRDEPAQVRETIEQQLSNPEVQVIITTGGTGLSTRDSTHEAIQGLFEKRLEGFGELFRMLSYHEIGSAAMMSRACAGTSHGKVVVSLPGSENAVRLAMTKLILPELGHMVSEVSR